jgi:hypothetical protein
MREAEPRFVGLDLHRHDVMAGAVTRTKTSSSRPSGSPCGNLRSGLPVPCAPPTRWR